MALIISYNVNNNFICQAVDLVYKLFEHLGNSVPHQRLKFWRNYFDSQKILPPAVAEQGENFQVFNCLLGSWKK